MRSEVSCCRKKGKIGNDQISKNRGKKQKTRKRRNIEYGEKSALNFEAG